MADTPNLGLHQWAAGDAFLREEFNEDFAKIDTAVGEAPLKGHVTGTYRGTGDKTRPTTVTLGFSPSAIVIHQLNARDAPILLVRGQEITYADMNMAKLTATGFTVNLVTDPYNNVMQDPRLNSNVIYCYIAFR